MGFNCRSRRGICQKQNYYNYYDLQDMNIKFEAYSSFGVPFKVEGDEYIWNFPEEAPSQEAIDAKIQRNLPDP